MSRQLKDFLEAIDLNDKNFYNTLTPEEKKKSAPWVLMRYVASSATYPEHYMLMVNDLVNDSFSDLTKHPELQWKLLALCGAGKKVYHPWIAPPKKKAKNKIHDALSKLYPNKKDDEIELIEKLHSAEDLVDLFLKHGFQDKDIEEIFG